MTDKETEQQAALEPERKGELDFEVTTSLLASRADLVSSIDADQFRALLWIAVHERDNFESLNDADLLARVQTITKKLQSGDESIVEFEKPASFTPPSRVTDVWELSVQTSQEWERTALRHFCEERSRRTDVAILRPDSFDVVRLGERVVAYHTTDEGCVTEALKTLEHHGIEAQLHHFSLVGSTSTHPFQQALHARSQDVRDGRASVQTLPPELAKRETNPCILHELSVDEVPISIPHTGGLKSFRMSSRINRIIRKRNPPNLSDVHYRLAGDMLPQESDEVYRLQAGAIILQTSNLETAEKLQSAFPGRFALTTYHFTTSPIGLEGYTWRRHQVTCGEATIDNLPESLQSLLESSKTKAESDEPASISSSSPMGTPSTQPDDQVPFPFQSLEEFQESEELIAGDPKLRAALEKPSPYLQKKRQEISDRYEEWSREQLGDELYERGKRLGEENRRNGIDVAATWELQPGDLENSDDES